MIQCSTNSGLLLHVRNPALAEWLLANCPWLSTSETLRSRIHECLSLTKTAFAAKLDNR